MSTHEDALQVALAILENPRWRPRNRAERRAYRAALVLVEREMDKEAAVRMTVSRGRYPDVDGSERETPE